MYDFECTWWRIVKKRVVRTKLDIYVFIPISSSRITWAESWENQSELKMRSVDCSKIVHQWFWVFFIILLNTWQYALDCLVITSLEIKTCQYYFHYNEISKIVKITRSMRAYLINTNFRQTVHITVGWLARIPAM